MRLFWLLCCIHGMGLYAQDPVAIRYTVDHGLPSNEVYDVHQDRDGYIWFATDHGIARFDGYEFKAYSTYDGLSDNTVFGFTEDPSGRTWMRCMNGTLSYMDGTGIHPYPYNAQFATAFPGAWIETFAIDEDYRMYFNTDNGCFSMALCTGVPQRILFPEAANMDFIHLKGLPRHFLGAECRDLKANEFSRVMEDANHLFISAPLVIKWFERKPLGVDLKNGDFAGVFERHLFLVKDGVVTKDTSLGFKPNSIYADHNGNIWLAGNGLLRLDNSLALKETYFSSEAIFDILQDSEGSYWVATRNGVLFIRNMDYRLHERIDEQAMGEVGRLRLVDSTLFLQHGWTQIKAMPLERGTSKLEMARTINFSIPSVTFQDFLPIPEKNCLLVNRSPFAIDPRKEVAFRFPVECIRTSGSVWQYHQSAARILMAGRDGFAMFDKLSDTCKSSKIQLISSCYSILEDESGLIWIGAMGGLYNYDGKHVWPFLPDEPAFRARIIDLMMLPHGGLAVSTRGHGILMLDIGKHTSNKAAAQTSRRQWIQLDKSAGLASNFCGRIYLGASGLWVCSNEGLSLVKWNAGDRGQMPQIETYTIGNGLPGNKINDVVEFGGHVYVATPKGLVVFKAGQAPLPLPQPPVNLLGLEAGGRNVKRDEPLGTDEDDLRFEFIAPLFSLPGKAEYEFMLEGRDLEWRPSRERTAAYYDLPPGHYDFRLRARAPGGPWSAREARMQLDLPEKFHESALFRWGLAAAIALMLFLIGRMYFISRQRRIHNNMIRLQSEIKALRSQMRPHFIFNALNSIQHLILLNDNATAQVHLARFAKLMRNILEATNHEAIPVSSEIDILQMYLELERLRFGDSLTYSIDVQQGVDWTHNMIPPMLLQPIVENAVWHGLRMQKMKPNLWIRFHCISPDRICCEIEDNGIGRKAASQVSRTHPGTSVGLGNIQERIRLINATHPAPITLEIHDLASVAGEAQGTLVKLFIPIRQHAERKT
jgi:ligand-binding sensor domain-containing protein